ncbi:MAG: S1 RNA-binding domain-containing protein [Bacteroides sp.]|nr:S1 RNA-binding domain-containing protein [Prevotella sp.]MCM1407583.1 S1 RNA-binding domain-containing protein [Treponema brennaborense]MCM1469267.1 S1 RNA-binding domain-containing protein [Bacteroides sp.]
MNKFIPGQELKTKIVAISGDTIFLDLNSKTEGILNAAELTDQNGNITVQEGEEIKVFFAGEQNGELRFTTKISIKDADHSMLENAYSNSIPIEGYVEKEIKGGYEIKIGKFRAFCPYSQIGSKQKNSSDSFLGKHITFRILEYGNNGQKIIVSNRAIQEAEHADMIETLKNTLKENMTVSGKIISIQSFGAFVDIHGFKALLPVSEISMKHIDDITAVLSEGQEITARIIKIDWQLERMTLSMKALLADPWEQAADIYREGKIYNGIISRTADYGLFITLEPGIDGLLHISELENVSGSTNLRKLYRTGSSMRVQIKEINIPQRRIALRPAVSAEQEETSKKYLAQQKDEDDTYNPFAVLLKKGNNK